MASKRPRSDADDVGSHPQNKRVSQRNSAPAPLQHNYSSETSRSSRTASRRVCTEPSASPVKLRRIARDSTVWGMAKSTCLGFGLDPVNPTHKPAVCSGCTSYWKEKLKFNLSLLKNEEKSRRFKCKRPFDYLGTETNKADARDKLKDCFTGEELEVESEAMVDAKTETSLLLSQILQPTGNLVSSLNKTKTQRGPGELFDDDGTMSVYLIDNITKTMAGRKCLKENKVVLMNVLLAIHVSANPPKIQKQKNIVMPKNEIAHEFLDGVSPGLKSKTALSVTEERLLGQLSVVAFCNDAPFILLSNFPKCQINLVSSPAAPI